MKAAVLYQTGKPLVIEENIIIPELKAEQVLVKIAYSGLCHSQLMEVQGDRGKDHYLPHLLGHEGSGIVIKVGKKVKKVKPGDYVILGWIKGEGNDAGGTTYRKGSTIINAGSVTTFSNYSVVSENRCVKLPEGIPLDIAVLFGCAIPTGAGIVINEIAPQQKDVVAVFGLGGIGLSALMAIHIFECQKVIAIDIEEDKLIIAKDFGATHTVNSKKENPIDVIRQFTNGKGADYSIEAAGTTLAIEQAFQSVHSQGGLCIFASHPKADDRIRIDPYDLICGKQIRGTWGGNCNPDRDIPRFAKLYRDGKLPLKKMISHRYSLDTINEALNDLKERRIIRALIEINTTLMETPK